MQKIYNNMVKREIFYRYHHFKVLYPSIYDMILYILTSKKDGGFPMKQDCVRFTVCIDKRLFERLCYVSEFYGCPKSHEIRRMIERDLVQFERKYGPIPVKREKGLPTQY